MKVRTTKGSLYKLKVYILYTRMQKFKLFPFLFISYSFRTAKCSSHKRYLTAQLIV